MDKFIKTMRRLKRPLNYIFVIAFLFGITLFPTHFMVVAGTLASLPNWIGLLFASIIGGSHLIRSYKRDILDKD